MRDESENLELGILKQTFIYCVFALPSSVSQRNAERHGFRLCYVKAMMKAERKRSDELHS